MDPTARSRWERERPGAPSSVNAACRAPWVALEFDPSGIVYACCASHLYPVGRVPEMSLSEIWTGHRMNALRQALQDWDLSVACGSCRWHLETGRFDPDAAVYDRYALDSPHPEGPTAMTFALSNRCNLGCVMCSPDLSSTLRHHAGLPPLPSPYGEAFFDQIRPLLPALQYAKFLGGEPFLVEEHHRIWDLMLEVGAPPRIQVTTNGTIWNDRVEWLLANFAVDVTVSIDAVDDDTYRAIRGGVDPAAVRRNVTRFLQNCRSRGTEFRFCFCLMNSNSAELAPLLSWAASMEVPVSVNVVSDPGMALYDGTLDELAHVAVRWDRQSAEFGHELGVNFDVWRTQVRQLQRVIEGRAAGRVEAPRHARQEAMVVLSSVPPMPAPRDDAPVDRHRGRLAEWAPNGEVAEVRVGGDRRILRVVRPAPAVGIGADLVGCKVEDILNRIADASGRSVWLVAHEELADAAVRSFVISDGPPARGSTGAVVRTVSTPSAGGELVVLIAVDDFYASAGSTAATPVDAPGRRT